LSPAIERNRQKLGVPAVGQKAEMSNAHEAFGTDVQQEATQDLSTGRFFS